MIIVPAAGFFWLLSGEPANSGILVICSVFVAFMATVRHPDRALRGILDRLLRGLPAGIAALLRDPPHGVQRARSRGCSAWAFVRLRLPACHACLSRACPRCCQHAERPTALQNQMTFDATAFSRPASPPASACSSRCSASRCFFPIPNASPGGSCSPASARP